MNSINNIESSAVPDCPICLRGRAGGLCYRKNGYCIYRCPSCGLMFVYPRLSPEDLSAIYDAGYFMRGDKYALVEKTGIDPNFKNDLKKIETIHQYRKNGRLLDIGCAKGGFLKAAKDKGFEVQGVEISDYAACYARDTLGVLVENCSLTEADFPADHFDVVTMWDVLEHLHNPGETLMEVNRILKKGGHIFITTGDAGSSWARLTGRFWQLLTPPQHLFFFNKKSLEHILAANGFSVRVMTYQGKFVTIGFALFKAFETFGRLCYH